MMKTAVFRAPENGQGKGPIRGKNGGQEISSGEARGIIRALLSRSPRERSAAFRRIGGSISLVNTVAWTHPRKEARQEARDLVLELVGRDGLDNIPDSCMQLIAVYSSPGDPNTLKAIKRLAKEADALARVALNPYVHVDTALLAVYELGHTLRDSPESAGCQRKSIVLKLLEISSGKGLFTGVQGGGMDAIAIMEGATQQLGDNIEKICNTWGRNALVHIATQDRSGDAALKAVGILELDTKALMEILPRAPTAAVQIKILGYLTEHPEKLNDEDVLMILGEKAYENFNRERMVGKLEGRTNLLIRIAKSPKHARLKDTAVGVLSVMVTKKMFGHFDTDTLKFVVDTSKDETSIKMAEQKLDDWFAEDFKVNLKQRL